jgi:hypothetical protein
MWQAFAAAGCNRFTAYLLHGHLLQTPKAQAVVIVSWVFFVLLWVSTGLNMGMMRPDSGLVMAVIPVYGLVQRSLFLVWLGWCAIVGVLLWRWAREIAG